MNPLKKHLEESKRLFEKKFGRIFIETKKPLVDLESMLRGGDKTIYGEATEYFDETDSFKSFLQTREQELIKVIAEMVEYVGTKLKNQVAIIPYIIDGRMDGVSNQNYIDKQRVIEALQEILTMLNDK
jgi:hypothetical protein